MGFVKDVAKFAVSPAASLFSKSKKKPGEMMKPQPTMISNMPYERPMSLIGSRRSNGGY
jgi:hypothetical protein